MSRSKTPPARAHIGVPGGPTGRVIGDPGAAKVWLGSDDPVIDVTCQLTGPIVVTPPRPKITTVDRPNRIGLTQWVGQDPYEVQIPLMLDGWPDRSVERDIAALESLAEVAKGHDEPPVVRVVGPVPKAHPNLRWWLSAFSDPERVIHLPDGARCRYATVVTLTQRVTDRRLKQSLAKKGKGIANRSHVVKKGEDSFFDVARHEYHDADRAIDIARANSMRLAAKLHVGHRLRLP